MKDKRNFVRNILLAYTLMPVAYGMYPNHQSVANLFTKFRLASQDPAISMACFSNYILKSNEVGETFGREYNQCLLDTKASRQATEAKMFEKRAAIRQSSQDICNHLSACDAMNTTLEVFDCHAKIGANNTKTVYSISGNASEHASVLQEKYRIADLRHEKCCKNAERSYVELTAVNYRNLKDCLDGRAVTPESTLTPTTITTPTTRTTTSTKPLTSTIKTELSPQASIE